ncbi:high nitrogen upregulated cytochrome P450 monooxygenase 2 [Fomes fomentarius]|nr:high nitrogen upregulated cytochrome P450 monooxygenase 2 [Fomes fomentarius]
MTLEFLSSHFSVLPVTVNVACAMVAHQVFRKYETYRLSVHFALLFGPPTLTTTYYALTSRPPSPPILHTFLVFFETYLAALILSVVLYRLSPLHPLYRYPGPVSHRISFLVPALKSISGKRCKDIRDLHALHGDVVRFGPNDLSIIDASLVTPILGVFGLPKGPYVIGGSMSDEHISMIGIQDNEEHAKRRRAWNRGLSPGAIKEYEGIIMTRTKQLVRRLEEQHGEVALDRLIKYFSYDFMCDMAFGGGSELLRDGDSANVWSIIEHGMVFAMFLTHVPWLGFYLSYIPGAVGPLNTLTTRGREFAATRLARGSSSRDLFHYLNNEDLPGKEPPPPQQLTDDGVLAVVAGSDTTSIVLISLFFCILAHPDTYEKLQNEVDRFYPQGESPSSTELHREMHYLHAVIQETMRLFPPVPGGTQRRVPLNGIGLTIGSLHIPPGTTVHMSPWCLHRDARNFTYPDTFWPERWLIASGQLRLEDAPPPSASGLPKNASPVRGEFVHNETAWIPFSHGPMNCPGKALAMLELRTVVCAILQRFRIRLREGWDTNAYEQNCRDYYTAAPPSFPVSLEGRW